jgi:hypothetical protein
MQEAFYVLVGLGVLLALVVTGIVAWIAHFRSARIGALSTRVTTLERELAQLRASRLADGAPPVVASAAPPKVEPIAPRVAPVTPLTAQPLPTPPAPSAPRPFEATPRAASTAPAHMAPTPPPAAAPFETVSAPSEPPRAPFLPPPAPSPMPAMPRIDWERWIGVRGAAARRSGARVRGSALLPVSTSAGSRPRCAAALRAFESLGIAGGVLRRRDYRVMPDARRSRRQTLYGATWARNGCTT